MKSVTLDMIIEARKILGDVFTRINKLDDSIPEKADLLFRIKNARHESSMFLSDFATLLTRLKIPRATPATPTAPVTPPVPKAVPLTEENPLPIPKAPV
jgi:hypothetical protein